MSDSDDDFGVPKSDRDESAVSGDVASLRQRRRTKRARRSLRVPVDEVPRRSSSEEIRAAPAVSEELSLEEEDEEVVEPSAPRLAPVPAPVPAEAMAFVAAAGPASAPASAPAIAAAPAAPVAATPAVRPRSDLPPPRPKSDIPPPRRSDLPPSLRPLSERPSPIGAPVVASPAAAPAARPPASAASTASEDAGEEPPKRQSIAPKEFPSVITGSVMVARTVRISDAPPGMKRSDAPEPRREVPPPSDPFASQDTAVDIEIEPEVSVQVGEQTGLDLDLEIEATVSDSTPAAKASEPAKTAAAATAEDEPRRDSVEILPDADLVDEEAATTPGTVDAPKRARTRTAEGEVLAIAPDDLVEEEKPSTPAPAPAAAVTPAAPATPKAGGPLHAPPPPPASVSAAATPAQRPADAAAAAAAQVPASGPAEAPRKKRSRPWFEEFFNDDYLRTVRPPKPAQVARQCDFIESSLGLSRGATILDVGCGLGLHAVELAARGYLVVGLDLSLPMLSRAADEAQDRGQKINFLHADMREMSFEGAFDAIVCWGTTFGYFDDEGNRKVIERFHRALKPGGLVLLDVGNRDFVIRAQPNLVWFEGDGCVCMEETQFNYITSRLHVKRTVILEDGRQRENDYSIRLYSLHELGGVLHHQGFRVAEVSGLEATPSVFFGGDSPRVIILAERRVGPPPGAPSTTRSTGTFEKPESRSEPSPPTPPKPTNGDH